MNKKQEGDVYKIIELYGKQFEIQYGFYEDFEKKSRFGEPIPIYPNFSSHPVFTDAGFPFVTQMQDACEHAITDVTVDACCVDCAHFSQGEDLIGICTCEKRKGDISRPESDSTSKSIRLEESL